MCGNDRARWQRLLDVCDALREPVHLGEALRRTLRRVSLDSHRQTRASGQFTNDSDQLKLLLSMAFVSICIRGTRRHLASAHEGE